MVMVGLWGVKKEEKLRRAPWFSSGLSQPEHKRPGWGRGEMQPAQFGAPEGKGAVQSASGG